MRAETQLMPLQLKCFRYHFTYRITHCRVLNIVYSSDQQCNYLGINFNYFFNQTVLKHILVLDVGVILLVTIRLSTLIRRFVLPHEFQFSSTCIGYCYFRLGLLILRRNFSSKICLFRIFHRSLAK